MKGEIMTRKDFIDRLFDNGDGLTLEQIKTIYIDVISSELPADLVDAIMESNNFKTDNEALPIAIDMSCDNFINNLHDCADMIELRDYLTSLVDCNGERFLKDITDKQVMRVWYSTGNIER